MSVFSWIVCVDDAYVDHLFSIAEMFSYDSSDPHDNSAILLLVRIWGRFLLFSRIMPDHAGRSH